jgi:signal recognition particle GTPase
MSENRKYILVSWYYDEDDVDHFKAINPIDKLLTIGEASKLLTKLQETFKNHKIKGIRRIGEEITTLERYNQMLKTERYDPIADLLPGLSLIPTNITNESTFGEVIGTHIKPKVGSGNNSIEEIIEMVMKD